jgi:rhodanese-related sulfurtransferase
MNQHGSNLPIEIDYQDIHKQTNSIVIDCRTIEEFETGHLKNAINVPLQYLTVSVNDLPCNCNDSIYVYCKSGNRSSTFTLYLRSIGYNKCQSIAGGIEEWGESEQC